MTLSGKVALVTGATRGVGRGIAEVLGEAAATVYVTGRTASKGASIEPGTIEAVAAEVEARGGRGLPVRCDHADARQIAALFARISEESGRLDLLVNNVHSGLPDVANDAGLRFFELDPERWGRMNRVGLEGSYAASVHAARMMAVQRSGLIVNVSSFGALGYLFDVAYGTGKAALDRLTKDMARELRPSGVAVVSLWPGFVWTETTLPLRPQATPGYRLTLDAYGELPAVSGHAVVALALDPRILRRSGRVHVAAEVAARHGFREASGLRPLSPRSLRRLARALLPEKWQTLARLTPPLNVPFFLVGPALTRFSEALKIDGGFRGAADGKG